MKKNIIKKKTIKQPEKVVLEFDNEENPNPLNTHSNDMEQEGIDIEYPNYDSNDTSFKTPLSVPSFKNPKKTSFGGLGKKIKGIFHKKKKPSIQVSTELSSPNFRGEKKPMTEIEKLEFEFEQKKLLLKKKQEQEIQNRIKQQEKIIQQQKNILKQPKKTYETNFISETNDVELNPSGNIEPINYCQNCGKKLKKGKIIEYVNGGYSQEIYCKKCGFSTELKLRV